MARVFVALLAVPFRQVFDMGIVGEADINMLFKGDSRREGPLEVLFVCLMFSVMVVMVRASERQTETQRPRKRERKRERQRDRQRQTETQTETQRPRKRERLR